MEKSLTQESLYFRIFADFEADNGIDNSNKGNETTNIDKENPFFIGSCIVSELNYV